MSDDPHAQARQYQADRRDEGQGFLYSEECIRQKLRGMRSLLGATRRSDLMEKPFWVRRAVQTCKHLRVWARGIPVNFGGYQEEVEHVLDQVEAALAGEPHPEIEQAAPPPAKSVRDVIDQAVKPMPDLTPFEKGELAAQEREARA